MNPKLDEPIDFSALNPARDAADFDRRVERISTAAGAILARRRSAARVSRQMLSWAGPILSAAAVIALGALGLYWFDARTTAPAAPVVADASQQQTPAAVVVTWAMKNHLPKPAEFFALDWRTQP